MQPSTATRHAHQSGAAAKPKSVPGSAAPSTAGHAVPTTGHAAGTNTTDGGGRGQTTAAGRDVVALLAPGSYDYHVTGSSQSALGSKNYDGTSTLRVDSPQGNRQHTKQQDDDGSTEQVLVAGTDGLHLADLHLAQSGFDEDFRPNKPVLLMPAHASQGQHWTWSMTSTDGKYTLHARLQVSDAHSAARTTNGTDRHTITVSSVLVLHSKDIDVTIHQQDQPTRGGVIVREHAVTDGTAYGTKFHSDLTRTLTSQP